MNLAWERTRVLVTGGASFIGSHLVDRLVETGVGSLRVVDDLSTGRRENLAAHLKSGAVEFVHGDLLDYRVARAVMRDVDVVFHLAAIHGGRGYIDTHQSACAQSLALDEFVIREAHLAGVAKLVFASSGCVYPLHLQADPNSLVMLTEAHVGPPYNADGMYGWSKLLAELSLRAYHAEHGLKSVSCRLFTAYGERCLESHAVIAMIARAFLRQDPFEIWGDGEQVRNWTYVGDIAAGLVAAATAIDDGSAFNLGTEHATRVIDAARAVTMLADYSPRFVFRTDMPVGPRARVASSVRAGEQLGWAPEVSFIDGLRRTYDWYCATHDREELRRDLDRRLLER